LGRARGRVIARQAQERDVELAKHERAWQASDCLQDEYPTVGAYLRAKTHLSKKTIRRSRLRRQGGH
jgi:hypothetical protein